MMNASLVLKVLLLFTQVETMIFLNKSSLLQSSAAALHNVNDLKSFCIYLLKVLFSNHYPQISPSNISLKIDHENCPNMLFKAAPSAAFRRLIPSKSLWHISIQEKKVWEWCQVYLSKHGFLIVLHCNVSLILSDWSSIPKSFSLAEFLMIKTCI